MDSYFKILQTNIDINMKNRNSIWSLVTIVVVTMLSVGFTSCGGDDDEDFSTSNPNTGTKTESTATLATEQVKKITMKPILSEEIQSDNVNNEECLIYKDFYYKHTLCLEKREGGIVLCINSYIGNGGGWNHSFYRVAVIKAVGPVSSIKEIVNKSHFEYWDLQNSFYEGGKFYDWFSDFKPGYGYEVAFYTGPSKELKWLRVFPTNYTLDKNDVVTSATLEYQLY